MDIPVSVLFLNTILKTGTQTDLLGFMQIYITQD